MAWSPGVSLAFFVNSYCICFCIFCLVFVFLNSVFCFVNSLFFAPFLYCVFALYIFRALQIACLPSSNLYCNKFIY